MDRQLKPLGVFLTPKATRRLELITSSTLMLRKVVALSASSARASNSGGTVRPSDARERLRLLDHKEIDFQVVCGLDRREAHCRDCCAFGIAGSAPASTANSRITVTTKSVTIPMTIPANRLMPGRMLLGGPSPCISVIMKTTAA